MGKRLNVTASDRFGELTIVKEVEPIKWRKYKKRMFLCKCHCGKETIVRLEYLRSGHTKTCGCAIIETLVEHRLTHGLTGTRLHRIWNGMKGRCYNQNRKSYKDYGAKGVTVCEEWHDFEPFYKWAMNNGYEQHLTIERKDPFGNYDPPNCEWIPKGEQAKNKRCHVVNAHV